MTPPQTFNCRCIARPIRVPVYTFTCNSASAARHFSHVWYLG